jgi:hypothetical protein
MAKKTGKVMAKDRLSNGQKTGKVMTKRQAK